MTLSYLVYVQHIQCHTIELCAIFSSKCEYESPRGRCAINSNTVAVIKDAYFSPVNNCSGYYFNKIIRGPL